MEISLDDEIDFDDLELDNIGSDPNIEFDLLWRIPVQEQLKKYPDEDSPSDVWLLPSGKTIHEVIRGPRNLRKSQ